MAENNNNNKARAGFLPIASPRFRSLGENLPRGSFHTRKTAAVKAAITSLESVVEIVLADIVYERQHIHAAIELFFVQKVDFVIVEFISWSEDFAWIRFLRDMPEVPVLLINAVQDRMSFENTLDDDDFIDFLCTGTLVGSLEGSGSIPRTGRKNVKILIGDRHDLLGQITRFSRAAKVRNVLRQARFGLLANYNELMWATYVDPYNLFAKVGPELRFISYSEMSDELEAVSDSEADAFMHALAAKHPVMQDVEERLFRESVRVSIALAKLADRMEIDALIFNDVDPVMLKQFGLRPGFYHPSFHANNAVMVPEADIGGGMITLIMKLLSGKHVNFIEPFYIEAATGTFAGGHAGPNDHNDPAYPENVIIARDVRFAGSGYKYAGAPFAWYRIPAGRKTMAHFSENNGNYKIIATLVDSLEGDHMLASYSHTIFKPVVPVATLFEKILNIGSTQHFAVVDGDYLAELRMLSEIMDFDYYEIL